MTIHEQAVQAAARALAPDPEQWEILHGRQKQLLLDKARRALEAALPLMGVQRPEDMARGSDDFERGKLVGKAIGWNAAKRDTLAMLATIPATSLALPHTGQPQEGDGEPWEYWRARAIASEITLRTGEPVAWRVLTTDGPVHFTDEAAARQLAEARGDKLQGLCVCAASPRAEGEWQDISTYKKDGTLVQLLVRQELGDRSSNPTEDEIVYRTIGHNNADHDGIDEWQFAGWNWESDHWTEGHGTPIHWRPLPAPPHIAEKQTEAK